MDVTDIPEGAYDGAESPPDLTELESPETLLKDGPIRERLLDVITGLRTPTKVSDIADLADCGTETGRDYLTWIDEMGMVHRHNGRPVRYERNNAYFQWRRIDRLRDKDSEQELVDELTHTHSTKSKRTERNSTQTIRTTSLWLKPAETSQLKTHERRSLSGKHSNSEQRSSTRRDVTTLPPVALPATSMPDQPGNPPSTGPIDTGVLDRIAAHLRRSARFESVHARPAYAPNAVVADYDLGYFPSGSHAHRFGSDGSRPTTSASTTSTTIRTHHEALVEEVA